MEAGTLCVYVCEWVRGRYGGHGLQSERKNTMTFNGFRPLHQVEIDKTGCLARPLNSSCSIQYHCREQCSSNFLAPV